MRGKRKKRT